MKRNTVLRDAAQAVIVAMMMTCGGCASSGNYYSVQPSADRAVQVISLVGQDIARSNGERLALDHICLRDLRFPCANDTVLVKREDMRKELRSGPLVLDTLIYFADGVDNPKTMTAIFDTIHFSKNGKTVIVEVIPRGGDQSGDWWWYKLKLQGLLYEIKESRLTNERMQK